MNRIWYLPVRVCVFLYLGSCKLVITSLRISRVSCCLRAHSLHGNFFCGLIGNHFERREVGCVLVVEDMCHPGQLKEVVLCWICLCQTGNFIWGTCESMKSFESMDDVIVSAIADSRQDAHFWGQRGCSQLMLNPLYGLVCHSGTVKTASKCPVSTFPSPSLLNESNSSRN